MLSIVIPTLNEERAIGATLGHALRQQGDFEMLVSDGGSVDHTRDEVSRHAGVRWLSGPCGRAAQMNRGAREARGELLLFLHADTLLPPGAVAMLNRVERCGRPVAGGFPHRFRDGGPLIRLASWVHSTRSLITGMYFGDQAPFVSRALFLGLGGFGNLPVMEDVDFAMRVRRCTTPLRMPWPVENSPRKIERRGVLRSAVEVLYLLGCHRLGRTRHLEKHGFFEPIR